MDSICEAPEKGGLPAPAHQELGKNSNQQAAVESYLRQAMNLILMEEIQWAL
jgi:hypothetical protein